MCGLFLLTPDPKSKNKITPRLFSNIYRNLIIFLNAPNTGRHSQTYMPIYIFLTLNLHLSIKFPYLYSIIIEHFFTKNLIAMRYKDFTYEQLNKGIEITGYEGYDKDLVIPGEIEGVSVVRIGVGAFANNNLETVEIPDSVREIWDWAFYNNDLKTIEIPDGVREIGYRAFSNNALETIQIPDSVREIGNGAFYNNNLKPV